MIYLYTGATDCMAERAPELLQIAEKYDLDELKEDCEYVMAESLSCENAAMFWLLADAHNARTQLKHAVRTLFTRNKVDLMQPTVLMPQ
ncbi:Speckle-type POZ protein-like B [Orchesella cincta]|uniref:Speckle-type POZ protein-like B n=1 Tax=Orchesella cincta TaxID=48709 RepID=A0A1D2MAK6_ORCCI|nr:Speckle-type POZ protein-like B [Orchesella cincta]